jgi:hypothetical protein
VLVLVAPLPTLRLLVSATGAMIGRLVAGARLVLVDSTFVALLPGLDVLFVGTALIGHFCSPWVLT